MLVTLYRIGGRNDNVGKKPRRDLQVPLALQAPRHAPDWAAAGPAHRAG